LEFLVDGVRDCPS